MTERVQTSWTGSERQRREQGVCRPPKHKPNTTPRFMVRAGTRVEVRRADRNRWFEYVTQRDLRFERRLRYADYHYFFREGAYELRVHRSRVDHRADAQRTQEGLV